MQLSDIDKNDSCIVIGINEKCDLIYRLKELGFIKGQEIICTNKSIFGSPAAYKLCGTKIALRKNAAQSIEVKLSEK